MKTFAIALSLTLLAASSASALPWRGRHRTPQRRVQRLRAKPTRHQRAMRQLGRREAVGHVLRIGALALPVAEYAATGHISGASLLTTLGTFWLGGHLVNSAAKHSKALRKQQAHRESARSWQRITAAKSSGENR
ncbi:MAG: hypothetical protein KC503_45845 [Myxococcales bacterium]|nr:hypothetical protein [Myxococcales bacterium]